MEKMVILYSIEGFSSEFAGYLVNKLSENLKCA